MRANSNGKKKTKIRDEKNNRVTTDGRTIEEGRKKLSAKI